MREESGLLEIAPRESAEFIDRSLSLARSAPRGLILHPWTEAARALGARLVHGVAGARLHVHQSNAHLPGAPPAAAWEEADAVIFTSAPGDLGADLLQLVDFPWLKVLAPRTADYYRNRPLFLVSIPKSGTHLLNKLAEVMGYTLGIVHDEFALPGHWYCVEYSNSHTVARDFFVDSVRRAPFGNRHHAFTSAPAVFIYRHPLDVLVSEANYYHREGKTSFAGYLSGLAFEQRVHRLLDDPWLLGGIRERIGGFAPWLEFQNVIPVSFEEVVGPKGGGRRDDQLRAIWSLQLKLQAPGKPHAIADQVFDRDSPTFYQGRIGAWRSSLSQEHLSRLRGLNKDFLDVFGYDLAAPEGELPRRAAEFRHRPLRVAAPLHDKVPIALEYHYLGFNLARFDGWVYAVPQATGPGFDLSQQPERRLRLLPRERNLPALKHRLFVKSLWWAGSAQLLSDYVVARLARADAWGGALRALVRTAARGLLGRAKR
jgi:hypothetical protein